jgi:hypothetical protein
MEHWIVSGLLPVLAAGITPWTAGAIYFDVGRQAPWNWVLLGAWCLFRGVLFATWNPPWCP